MKVTFVGAVVIVILAIIVIAILDLLLNQDKRGPDQNSIGLQ